MKNNLIFIFIIFIVFIYTAKFHGLIDPDEPRYATTAKNMVQSSNYVVPYFNGKLRINKPPLTYWLISLSYKLKGINELSCRLPHIFAAVILIILGYFIIPYGKNYFISILSSIPLFFYLARYCNTDMILTLFFSLTLLCFYIYYEKNKKIFLFLFYIFYFLTTLAKGPVSLIILPIIILFSIFEKKYVILKKIDFWIILIILTCSPFFYLIIVKNVINSKIALFSLLKRETTGRFLKGYRHPEPFYFYFEYFPALFFPWSIIFIYKFLKIKEIWKANSFNRFHIIWFFTIFLFFSFSKSKLISYILPASFPFAVIVSQMLNDIKFKNFKIPLFFSIILSLLIISFLYFKHYNFLSWNAFIIFLFLIIILIGFAFYKKEFHTGLSIMNLIIFISIFIGGANFIDENKSEKFLNHLTINKEKKVTSFKRDLTGIAFYLKNYNKCFKLKKIPEKSIVVMYYSNFLKIKDKINYNLLGKTKSRVAIFFNEVKNQ